MSDRDGQKGYIPWHERVDENLIRDLANQFVQVIYKHGLRLNDLKVNWKDDTGEFEIETTGIPLVRTAPPDGEQPH